LGGRATSGQAWPRSAASGLRMGCTSSRELHTLRAQKDSQAQIDRIKQEAGEKLKATQADHSAEVKDLNERITRMVEAHTTEVREIHEQYTEQIRRMQKDHHEHMKEELLRHVEDIKKLQIDYSHQLKNVDVQMVLEAVRDRNRWCGSDLSKTKERVHTAASAEKIRE